MKNFSENTEINILISQHLLKITDGKYTDDEWDCLELNKLDRQRHAEEIADIYFRKNDYNSIGGKKNIDEFIKFIRNQLDKLIPFTCYMNANRSFSRRYNTLLTKRIFYTHDKDYFAVTQNLVYKYEHDFSKEKKYIKETLATEKQIEYLEKLAGEQGFILINKEYLSNETAKKIISYLKGSIELEPRLFGFFIITV